MLGRHGNFRTAGVVQEDKNEDKRVYLAAHHFAKPTLEDKKYDLAVFVLIASLNAGSNKAGNLIFDLLVAQT